MKFVYGEWVFPDDGSVEPDTITTLHRRFFLAEFTDKIVIERTKEGEIRFLNIEEWKGPLWPFWWIITFIEDNMRYAVIKAMCLLLGHRKRRAFGIVFCKRCGKIFSRQKVDSKEVGRINEV